MAVTMDIKNICVYCGSSQGHDPRHEAAARALGAAIAKARMGLVFGGGACGLMGAAARAALEAGGEVCGVIPDFLGKREIALEGLTELCVVPDMHRRKQLMFEKSDAFVSLPGGIGTLEELAEQLTWAQLGRHEKPLVIADIGGFWRPLLHLFAHMREEGFINPKYEMRYLVAERVEDVIPMILAAASHRRAGAEEKSVIERL
jgi:uncharacterized protein (TIGR00730 family)